MEFNPRVISGSRQFLLGELNRLSVQSDPGWAVSAEQQALKLEKLPICWQPELARAAERLALDSFFSAPANHLCQALLVWHRLQLEALAEDLQSDPEKASLCEAINTTLSHHQRSTFSLKLKAKQLVLGPRPCLMGVLNVTPDSFYDGGRYQKLDQALAQAERMLEEGADIIDVGGQSSRPGSDELPPEEELARVIPVVGKLVAMSDVPVSIDTYRSDIAERALDAGAELINDITALRGDEKMAALAASRDVPVVLMHMQGRPKTMQQDPSYRDLMSEICLYLRQSIELACDAGVSGEQLVVDPGIGFGKTVADNLEIIARLRELASLGRPILIGPSRKSFIGAVLDQPAEERLLGTAASLVLARARGAHIFRVHEVKEAKEVLTMADAILTGGAGLR